MDDELTAESGLDALIALLDERGIEHYECVASECEATVYEDMAGNAHECWEGGESGVVNVVIAVTPEDALSVDDLNGVIRENAKLRELCVEMWAVILDRNTWWDWNSEDTKRFARLLIELGVELGSATESSARLLREWGIEVD
jgi:hypothetical protein